MKHLKQKQRIDYAKKIKTMIKLKITAFFIQFCNKMKKFDRHVGKFSINLLIAKYYIQELHFYHVMLK